MAIVKCGECGKEVSNQAKDCPNCGNPIKKNVGCGGLIFVILFTLGIFYIFGNILSGGRIPSIRSTSNISSIPKSQGTLTVDRAWDENLGGYRCSYALVTWENTTPYTFNEAVTIQAIAYDSSGQKINQNESSFFAHEYGSMTPGFKGTLKIHVELGQAQFARMECSIISAR